MKYPPLIGNWPYPKSWIDGEWCPKHGSYYGECTQCKQELKEEELEKGGDCFQDSEHSTAQHSRAQQSVAKHNTTKKRKEKKHG